MKNQVLKTISILSLFVLLSVSISNVSAFPSGCGRSCTIPPVQSAALASAQPASLATAPDTNSVTEPQAVSATAQPESSVWTRLAMFFASFF